jgi:hypothetical protein
VIIRVVDEGKFTTKDYMFFRKLLEHHLASVAAALDPASPLRDA